MNTPNKITLLRVVLVPFFVYFLLSNCMKYNLLIAGVIFVLASVTDHIDGKIARSRNQITSFGKFLDPLADKILVVSAFICFIQLGFIGAVPVIIILSREFLVTSVRLMAAGSGKVIAANFWGKAKTVSQMLVVSSIIFFRYFSNLFEFNVLNCTVLEFISNNFLTISRVGTWFSAVLTVISGAFYIKNNLEFIKPTETTSK